MIEPAWHTFIGTMSKVTNVDQVLDCHLTMVNSILDDSMLTNLILLEKMTTLLSLCLQFTEKLLNPDDPNSEQLSQFSSMLSVDELTESFNKELVNFLKEVSSVVQNPNQSSRIANIIYR